MNTKKDIYSLFSNNKNYYKKLVGFLRDNTTVETGGNKIFDGTFKDLLHIPEELADLIFFLKKHEKKNIIKIGLAISCQEIKRLPTNSFDKKMDFILTEKKLYK